MKGKKGPNMSPPPENPTQFAQEMASKELQAATGLPLAGLAEMLGSS